MVIHSGSPLLGFAYLVTFATAVGLLVSLAMLVARKFRTAARIAGASVAALGLYFLAHVVIGWTSPQTVVRLGDSYCWDLWCMGIQRVNATPRGSDIAYRIDVRFSSDANTVKTGIDEARFFLGMIGGVASQWSMISPLFQSTHASSQANRSRLR